MGCFCIYDEIVVTLKEFQKTAGDFQKTEQLPVLFVGHGSPMNAIEQNDYSRAWGELGKKLPKPKAVLCVSAHWLTEGTGVHIAKKPKTIHDFWGFPEELYEIEYGCPGAPEYAKETQALVKKSVKRVKKGQKVIIIGVGNSSGVGDDKRTVEKTKKLVEQLDKKYKHEEQQHKKRKGWF